MTDKAKRIIHSVGVFLTGAIFSMTIMGIVGCHVQNAYSEETSSLRQKRQEKTTTNGGYDRYSFTLQENFPSEAGYYNYSIYSVDTSTYTLTETASGTAEGSTSWTSLRTQVNELIQTATPSQSTTINFLAYWGYVYFWGTNSTPRYTAYFSFLKSQNNINIQNLPFVSPTSWTHANGYDLSSLGSYRQWENVTRFYLTLDKSNMYILDNVSTSKPITSVQFVDCLSYYREEGYQAGQTTGYADGYQEGYADGSESSMLFTDLGVNQMLWYRADLHSDAQTDTTASYRLLTFKDGNNQTYSVWATHYFAGSGNDDFLSVDLYSSTSPNSASYVTQLGKGITNYASSGTTWEMIPSTYKHFDFAQITGVFNNSIPMNYFMISGLPDNATGYQQGYNKGYQDALSSSASGVALDNVFGLFSKAFGSVASFFNLKVFGFLPLYWFFLVPIFIAVITLLLRMVKH